MKRCGWFDFEATKEKFPIRVDSYSGTFEIDLGENYDNKTFIGKDVEKLRGEAYAYLRDVTAGQWKPFIIVEHDSSGIQSKHKIYFEYRRLFRLEKDDGTFLWKKWNGPDDSHEGSPGGSSFGPDRDDQYRNTRCLPYSKETWNGLLEITKAIETVDKKIKEMVDSGDLEAKLKRIAAGTTHALDYSPIVSAKRSR